MSNLGWPVKVVAKGGIPVTEAANGLGTPCVEADNGVAVTFVESGGYPLTTGVRYSAEASALIARMTTPPDLSRKKLIDTTIGALIAAGIWAKLDALYLMAAADGQAARLNWLSASYPLTAAGSPAFTTDRGYQGDGSSQYLSTGFVPSSAGGKFQQNSGHIALWSRTNAATAGVDMGNSNTLLLPWQTSTGNLSHRVNAANSGTVAAANIGAGFFLSSRTGPQDTANIGYRNGLKASLGSMVSSAMDTSEIRVLGRSGSVSYSSRQLAFASIGGGLTATEVAAFYATINSYMTAVGAA